MELVAPETQALLIAADEPGVRFEVDSTIRSRVIASGFAAPVPSLRRVVRLTTVSFDSTVTVTYGAGWNLVSGDTRELRRALGAPYRWDADHWMEFNGRDGLGPAAGYKAHVGARTQVPIMVASGGTITVAASPSERILVGNPFPVTASIVGAHTVIAHDANSGDHWYQGRLAKRGGANWYRSTLVMPGQAVWILYSSTITISPALGPSLTSGRPAWTHAMASQ